MEPDIALNKLFCFCVAADTFVRPLMPPLGIPEIALATEVSFPAVEASFQCASCGEWNLTTVDESAGSRQSYVEDCQVCCKPNLLRIEWDNSAHEFLIAAELE